MNKTERNHKLSSLFKRTVELFHLIPLTPYGWGAIALTIILVSFPVWQEQDIVLTMFCSALTITIGLLSVATGLQTITTKKRFDLDLSPNQIEAGQNSDVFIELPKLLLWPTHQLEIRVEPHGEIHFFPILRFRPRIRLWAAPSSDTLSSIKLKAVLKPPHRGLWEVKECQVRIRCPLGLTSTSWHHQFKPAKIIRVDLRSETPDLELITSSSQPGDFEQSLDRTRGGDYYDLKPYYPGDNINKIVWKVYARSGELVTRVPEQTVSPETQTVIYVVARPGDDLVCANTLGYLELLERYRISFKVGCYGSSNLPALTHSEARELLVNSAFSAHGSLSSWAESFIKQLDSRQLKEGRILILCQADFLINSEQNQALVELGEYFKRNRLTPVFGIIPPPGRIKSKENQASSLNSWFKNQPPQAAPFVDYQTIEEFKESCFQRNWQVQL